MKPQGIGSPARVAGAVPDSTETEAGRKLVSLCIEAVAKHPVQFCAAERTTFANRVQESLAALGADAEASQILVAAEAVAETVERYNAQTQRRFEGLIRQFRALTRALLESGPGVSAALRQATEQLLSAQELPDLEARLTTCLEAAKAPADGSSSAAAESTPAQLPASPHVDESPAADPCTGLPTRSDAEAAIQRALSGGRQVYMATFYLHRTSLMIAHFGEAISDQVILFCTQHIATHLSGPNDALFRWSRPGFVALLDRGEPLLTVANEVHRSTSTPMSRFFETPSRTVYLPIKLTGEVLLLAGKSFDEVLKHIQQSFSAHGEAGD